MGFLDNIKRNLGVGGPKLTIDEEVLFVRADDATIPLAFTIKGGDKPAHVDKIRVLLSRLADQNKPTVTARALDGQTRPTVGATTLLYKQVIHDNNGQGWDIQPEEVLSFNFDVDFNNPATDTNTLALLNREFSGTSVIGYARRGNRFMEITAIADIDKVMVDPQDVLRLNVDLDV